MFRSQPNSLAVGYLSFPENRIQASLGHSFSNGLYLSANFSRDNSSNTFGIQLQLSPPLGNGYGYSAGITAPPQGDTTSTARLQYHHDHGEFQLGRSGSGNAPTHDASMSGAVLLAGGGHLTRPIRDSYAVVRVPGMKRVKVRVQNQQVGETDANGTLALPHLHAYMDNTLSPSIPPRSRSNYAVDSNSKVVTTGLSRRRRD
ncbi:MAG: fimbria/pilus outer membrane usher protein [Nitrosomonadales bacterium]|nr:fimbria/pilus outer membrane usher protein [Nitrosomonadales bacterium]